MKFNVYIYLFLLIIDVVADVLLFVNEYYVPAVILAAVAIIFIICLLRAFNHNKQKLIFMLNSLENDDFTFRFAEGKETKDYLFNYTLNRLRNIMSNEKRIAREKEKYFELMLNNVVTGIMTINSRGSVIQHNSVVLNIFGLSIFTHVAQLRRVDDNLPELMLSLIPEDSSKSFSFYNEKGRVRLSLRCTYVDIRGEKYKIIVVNDIAAELEENELNSWSQLIRVLTHEIMNSITPISSLSDSMLELYPDKDDNIGQGLEVISTTSKGLISFVNSYRTLTRIPIPKKAVVFVKKLINKVIILEKDDLQNNHIKIDFKLSDDAIMIFADENLISQVLLNLIKNAIYAVSENDGSRWIKINCYISNNEDVIVDVTNNGHCIGKEEQEQIFVPFYTTKNSGTGIGLSISRQIMRLHDGNLKLKSSTEQETTFSMILK